MNLPRSSLQSGFTLIELLVSITLTLLLVSGIGAAFIAIKQTVRDVNHFENAQDVLRSSRHMLNYSIKRASAATIQSVDQVQTLVLQQSNSQDCTGRPQTTAFTEQFRIQSAELQCRVIVAGVTGAWTPLITGIHALDFQLTANNRLVRFRISPQNLPGQYPTADLNNDQQLEPYVRLDIALKSIILAEAT